MNCKNDIVINFVNEEDISVKFINDKPLNILFNETIEVTGDHSKLKNLDYEHSGHTGFASSSQLSILDKEVIKKDLSILPKTNLTDDRSKMMIYIDNNGISTQASLSEVLGKLIRTSEDVPDDLQIGEYVFLEYKGDK